MKRTNKKKRFTVNCCGECPAHSYGLATHYCNKVNKIIGDADKILEECPYLTRKAYSSSVRKVRVVENPGYPLIKKIMKEKGITLVKMAKDLHIDKGYLSRILKYKVLSQSKKRANWVCAISDYLELTLLEAANLFPMTKEEALVFLAYAKRNEANLLKELQDDLNNLRKYLKQK